MKLKQLSSPLNQLHFPKHLKGEQQESNNSRWRNSSRPNRRQRMGNPMSQVRNIRETSIWYPRARLKLASPRMQCLKSWIKPPRDREDSPSKREKTSSPPWTTSFTSRCGSSSTRPPSWGSSGAALRPKNGSSNWARRRYSRRGSHFQLSEVVMSRAPL